MKSTNLNQAKGGSKSNSFIVSTLAVFTILLIIYYVVTRAFPKLIPTEANYGDYFYPRAIWLFPHVVLGIVATIIGPFQFVTKFRNKYLKLHRRMGRVYVISVILAGIAGMYLAVTSQVGMPYAVGLFGLGVVWATTAIMAFISIKNKKIELHREWMIRSYVVTFAFVSFRVFEDILMSLQVGTYFEVLTLMSWACWAVPLFIAEVFIQGRKIKN